MQIEKTVNTSVQKAVASLVENMKASGEIFTAQPIVWAPKVKLAVADRSEGEFNAEFNKIVFNNLPKELAPLNGVSLPLKGKGTKVSICIAVALRDWAPDDALVAKNTAAGRKVPDAISKGKEAFRCFAI